MEKIPVRQITLQNEPVSSGRFKIRDLKDLLNGKDLFHGLHRHDFFFLLAVQKGRGTHEIDFKKYGVNDNSIFILRPGQVHQLELKAGSAGFLAEFDTAFYQPKDNISLQRLIRAGSKNFCGFEAERFNKLYDLLAYMYREYAAKEASYADIIKASLDIFFIEFIRQSRNPDNNLSNEASYNQERLDQFMEQVATRVSTVKQVSEYASLLNISPYQLNAITRSALGKSASQVINEQIILEAKRYLLATANQVKDIADHLGYEDISYFIRFFKKHTGSSPDAFRKNFK